MMQPLNTSIEKGPSGLPIAIEALRVAATEYRKQPSEEAALTICRLTRRIWDLILLMLQAETPVSDELLSSSLSTLASACAAVSETSISGNEDASAHVKEMIGAMAERCTELKVLQQHGEMAFFNYLLEQHAQATAA